MTIGFLKGEPIDFVHVDEAAGITKEAMDAFLASGMKFPHPDSYVEPTKYSWLDGPIYTPPDPQSPDLAAVANNLLHAECALAALVNGGPHGHADSDELDALGEHQAAHQLREALDALKQVRLARDKLHPLTWQYQPPPKAYVSAKTYDDYLMNSFNGVLKPAPHAFLKGVVT